MACARDGRSDASWVKGYRKSTIDLYRMDGKYLPRAISLITSRTIQASDSQRATLFRSQSVVFYAVMRHCLGHRNEIDQINIDLNMHVYMAPDFRVYANARTRIVIDQGHVKACRLVRA